MHGTFGRRRETDDNSRWELGFLALPVIVAIVLIGLAIAEPNASIWISEAVQAEFSGINISPAAVPTQLAEPAGRMRGVKAN